MKTDLQLKKDIQAELEWDPSIKAAQVGVAVKDGVVVLTGHLDTYAERSAVQKAVQRVQGVHAIAMELDVKLDPGHKRGDAEIAAAAETALRWHAMVPHDRIQATVDKGWVSLKGEVDWQYQRDAAEKAVRDLTGIVGLSNNIKLKQVTTPSDVGARIRTALIRQAADEAKGIEVDVKGATVTLRGKVHSWAERSAAYTAAWSVPGISTVLNELKVGL
ncbi:BON domain-containing protein [Roseateles oligotrophus]|uniref:BON domain-containing protein n=1 Tax=Roseateles oligotrophus TaxID=1769250 RepID=A0ABT2YMM0_9BURK|nr:BON domain-containing protein [Roseateles oligotrophus]MCV2371314.1 BON domain-containing protein [Roseateles oligotrophus]